MKLVTGIEAIQSGKPFRWGNDGDWIYPHTKIDNFGFNPADFLERNWEIKQEPREFWYNLRTRVLLANVGIQAEEEFPASEGWIKVREVLDED